MMQVLGLLYIFLCNLTQSLMELEYYCDFFQVGLAQSNGGFALRLKSDAPSLPECASTRGTAASAICQLVNMAE